MTTKSKGTEKDIRKALEAMLESRVEEGLIPGWSDLRLRRKEDGTLEVSYNLHAEVFPLIASFEESGEDKT